MHVDVPDARPSGWASTCSASCGRGFGGPVGLSDHSGTIYPGLAAVALGAVVLEVHMTFSRSMFGPDSPVSLEPAELRTLVDGVRFLERARSAPVDKDGVAHELADMRNLFGKSLVSAGALPAGTVLTDEHLTARKPATGIPASERAVDRRTHAPDGGRSGPRPRPRRPD